MPRSRARSLLPPLPLLPLLLLVWITPATLHAQTLPDPNCASVREETLRHFQAILRFDTSDPPGMEKPAADYLKSVLEKEGVPVQLYALEPHRPNVVARLKGNGSKRPLLIMGHTDVVNVDVSKWTLPPFSATRDGGYVYGRGSVDDKDNVTAGLMIMLLLKRLNLPLDRDVIFLAEAGEEGSTRVGIQFMVNQHFSAIDAEYCLAEGANVTRVGGQVKFAAVQTREKIPRAIELIARGPSGHGSVPLQGNAVARLARAVAAVSGWRTPVRLNETTRAYFERLATISSPDEAARYRAVIGGDPAAVEVADTYFQANEPRHASMLRTSISPNIVTGGYRVNVIPSEARATLDVRQLPDEDPAAFLEQVRRIVNDTAVTVRYAARDVRPGTPAARLESEAFKTIEAAVTRNYQTVTLPTMATGATDMAYLRAKGIECYGIGPATDIEDSPLGFGAHSDQERIIEAELHRFVRFHFEIVRDLARSKPRQGAEERRPACAGPLLDQRLTGRRGAQRGGVRLRPGGRGPCDHGLSARAGPRDVGARRDEGALRRPPTCEGEDVPGPVQWRGTLRAVPALHRFDRGAGRPAAAVGSSGS